jgi:hypothetical protein
MCAALIIYLEAGYYVLITDEEDTLSWDRTEHAGWCVGLYADPDLHVDTDGSISDAQAPDSGIPALIKLIDQVMDPGSLGLTTLAPRTPVRAEKPATAPATSG